MNFMFSWQEQYVTRGIVLATRTISLVILFLPKSNIKFVSSRHRVISSIYFQDESQKCCQFPIQINDSLYGASVGKQIIANMQSRTTGV